MQTLAANAAIPAGLRKRQAFDASAAKGHAAGILFVAPDGDVLLLRRAGTPGVDNYVGHWALPGGGVEQGETPEQGATREAKEEIGVDADPASFKVFDETMTPNGMAFHTFAQPVAKKFWPAINDEHTGAGWFSLSELPSPMHPAVEKALRARLGDDLPAARDGLVAWASAKEDQAIDGWNEGDHPRGNNGQFGSGGSSSSLSSSFEKMKYEPVKTEKRSKSTSTHVFKFKDGHVSKPTIKKLGDSLEKEGFKPAGETGRTWKKGREAVYLEMDGHLYHHVTTPQSKKEAEDVALDEMIAMDKGIARATAVMATDSPIPIAMDRDSVREKTRDGRLIVKRTHVTKANVCPYRGDEIPGWEDLGLDPQRVYNLLRDPEELKKAAPTLNGVQLLIKHTPVKATDPHQDKTVGSFGTDAEFDGEYLDNSMFVNTQEAIDLIESGRQHELSAGYHYKPDMTPGIFRGTAFDGVMRDIVFNHVALVEDGRAGPDVVVGDEALKENEMAKATRFGAMTLSIVAAQISPLLAMDQKLTLPVDLFKPLTTKNFKEHRGKLLDGVKIALDGGKKLRKGLALDATMADLAKVVDAFPDDMAAGIDEPAPEDKQSDMDKMAAVEAPKAITEPGATYDAEPMKAFMKQCGMDDASIAKCMDMMPKNGLAGDESPEDKEKREKAEKEAQQAKDALAAKDAEMKDMVSKPAMDAALKAQAEAFDKRLAQVRDNERGVRNALVEVKPWVGEIPSMAFDSASDVIRHALVMRSVEGADKMHADALLPVLKSLPRAGARTVEQGGDAPLAMDSSAVGEALKMAPGLENISTIL